MCSDCQQAYNKHYYDWALSVSKSRALYADSEGGEQKEQMGPDKSRGRRTQGTSPSPS